MVKAYHGTQAYFAAVDLSKVGQNRDAEYGAGLYLTTDESYAEHYVDYAQGLVLSGDIDIEKLWG